MYIRWYSTHPDVQIVFEMYLTNFFTISVHNSTHPQTIIDLQTWYNKEKRWWLLTDFTPLCHWKTQQKYKKVKHTLLIRENNSKKMFNSKLFLMS